LVLTLSFLPLALNLVSSPRLCPRLQVLVLVLEHKVFDNITAMMTFSQSLQNVVIDYTDCHSARTWAWYWYWALCVSNWHLSTV